MALRPPDPKRVVVDNDGPSPVFKVSGIDEDVTEDVLQRLFSAHAPVVEVRMVRDKYSGETGGITSR
jgi:RNA recognition motif-containing protein